MIIELTSYVMEDSACHCFIIVLRAVLGILHTVRSAEMR